MPNRIGNVLVGSVLLALGVSIVLGGSVPGLSSGTGHALLMILSGGIAVGAAFARSRRALRMTTILGIFHGLLFFFGIMFNSPTQEGHFFLDPNINSIAPGLYALSIGDYLFHGLVAGGFLLNAYFWPVRSASISWR